MRFGIDLAGGNVGPEDLVMGEMIGEGVIDFSARDNNCCCGNCVESICSAIEM